jgi:muramoyltetrapeptide carboxypeptidase
MKPLKANTIIDIIAPAGKIDLPAPLHAIEVLLKSWGYQARFGKNLFGNHPFLSHHPDKRFTDLKKAIYAKDSDIIWAYRGGSGSAELLPLLDTLSPPSSPKLFLGFSDVTSLHIYFNQQWKWPTYHGPGAGQMINGLIDNHSLNAVQKLLRGELLSFAPLTPFNTYSKNLSALSGVITGGNLSIIIHTLGTPYQIQTENKILLLEDVNEPAYKIRRMLVHLKQAGIFHHITALLLGEFISSDTRQKQYIEDEIQEFAHQQNFPVFKTNSVGHGKTNYVTPLGLPCTFSDFLSD